MQNEPLHILVLGVGGNVSQGILKALALSSLRCRVVAACTSATASGLFAADRAYVSPGARDPAFLPWLLQVCREERIQAVLSGVEPVLDVLLAHADAIRAQTGAVCIANSAAAVAIGRDKLRTCEWLRDQGFAYPAFAPSEDAAALDTLVRSTGFPLIAKPRSGKGSGGILVLRDQAALDHARTLPGYVIEELLGDDQSEYTAACFTDRDDAVQGVIVLHRQLQHGTTVSARAGDFPAIHAMARDIAAALRPKGPCNIQLRMHRGRPTCFEINVRFSGTTPMRARLGFNDVEATLRHYILGEPATPLPVITRGQVLRYWNEIYVDPEAVDRLTRDARLDQPGDFPLQVEDYGQRP